MNLHFLETAWYIAHEIYNMKTKYSRLVKFWVPLIGGLILSAGLSNCSDEKPEMKMLRLNYPGLYNNAQAIQLEKIQPGLPKKQIDSIEKNLDLILPASYKKFLSHCGGFWAFGGAVKLGNTPPFVHSFEPFDKLTDKQKEFVKQRGGIWPPPSDGMLCFADFFLEADGDQVLFYTKDGLIKGEYPVYYYSHEGKPSVRKIADSFDEWLNKLPEYFRKEE
jgi:hypothetical protein